MKAARPVAQLVGWAEVREAERVLEGAGPGLWERFLARLEMQLDFEAQRAVE